MLYEKTHFRDDPYLAPYDEAINRRHCLFEMRVGELASKDGSFLHATNYHNHLGLHLENGKWFFREYAPNATEIFLIGDFSEWRQSPEFSLRRKKGQDTWEGSWPENRIRHGQRYHLLVFWNGGVGERIPAYARRVVQDQVTGQFEAQVWNPPAQFKWTDRKWRVPCNISPFIYEAHIGMAQESKSVGTYSEFRINTLPRIIKAGYNVIQLMAVMEHPYYGSFGYHVGSFFAASSRFGSPEELKELINAAHAAGIAVIMDIVHSHAVKNEREGLSRFDGTYGLYFHSDDRGWHKTWDSRCFDYSKPCTLNFLLSNCRFWLEEYHFDGFRFDGVTSMLYTHHGLGVDFVGYDQYFDGNVDENAYTYCALANKLIHEIRPDAITIAEDVSGMPGIASSTLEGGAGFDYRMAMGVTETWYRLVRDIRDEDWDMGHIWYALTDKRREEKTVSYVECHDQALVGGKTFLFQMMDSAIYNSMHRGVRNPVADRSIALHKMARLATAALCGGAYLNFIGNEFGHPEWVDFPREGNGFSYDHARRQWSLRDDRGLFFGCLADFDEAFIAILKKAEITQHKTRLLVADNILKILAFERNEHFFIFNFNPSEAIKDFSIIAPSGSYRGILNSDSSNFGGFERIEEGQDYPLQTKTEGKEKIDFFNVYLPPRTALVIRRTPPISQ